MEEGGRARILWLTGGFAALALGLVGVVLPIMPTAPFVLLAAYAFARSSPRLQHRLEDDPRFGPMIANWRRYGAISVRTKIYAVTAMAVSPFVTWFVGAPAWALIAQVFVLVGAAVYILTRPSLG